MTRQNISRISCWAFTLAPHSQFVYVCLHLNLNLNPENYLSNWNLKSIFDSQMRKLSLPLIQLEPQTSFKKKTFTKQYWNSHVVDEEKKVWNSIRNRHHRLVMKIKDGKFYTRIQTKSFEVRTFFFKFIFSSILSVKKVRKNQEKLFHFLSFSFFHQEKKVVSRRFIT